MISLLGLALMYWGSCMLDTDGDPDSLLCFVGGLFLIWLGFWLFGLSLDMPRSGSAFG